MREHDSKLTVAPSAQSSRIAGILFADVVGFSSLSDMEVVRFHYEFLGAHQAEIRGLHVARRSKHLLALGGGAHAVDMAGQERDAELVLELGDALAQPIDRQAELQGRRAETAVLDDLQERGYIERRPDPAARQRSGRCRSSRAA